MTCDDPDPRRSAGNRTWPLEDTSALRIIDGLYRCRKYIWNNDHKIYTERGLTWSQLMIVEALRNAPPHFTLSPTDLAVQTQSTTGGMAKMLAGLERLGLIVRVENASDKRSSLVSLTDKGAEVVETTLNEMAATNAAIFSEILTPEESEELAKMLSKFRLGLKAKFEKS